MSPERDLAPDSAALFAEAVSIMARLRGPGGCAWDREQTFDTIRKYTLEESYEVFDAIERRNWTDLCEELGDLLLQVLFYAQMASEPGYFTIADVITGLNRKLIRRHRLLNRLASISVCVAPNRHRLDSVNAKGDCRRCKCGSVVAPHSDLDDFGKVSTAP